MWRAEKGEGTSTRDRPARLRGRLVRGKAPALVTGRHGKGGGRNQHARQAGTAQGEVGEREGTGTGGKPAWPTAARGEGETVPTWVAWIRLGRDGPDMGGWDQVRQRRSRHGLGRDGPDMGGWDQVGERRSRHGWLGSGWAETAAAHQDGRKREQLWQDETEDKVEGTHVAVVIPLGHRNLHRHAHHGSKLLNSHQWISSFSQVFESACDACDAGHCDRFQKKSNLCQGGFAKSRSAWHLLLAV
eukprot:366450-Chlamydomonas_euryale.AAC.25